MAEPQLGHQSKRRAAMAGGGVGYVEGSWVGLSSLVLSLAPPKHVQMKLNILTPAHTHTQTRTQQWIDAGMHKHCSVSEEQTVNTLCKQSLVCACC